MKKAIYAGSFDPPTLAHFNVYRQAREVFDEVDVVVGGNGTKGSGLLTSSQRLDASTPGSPAPT